MWCINRVSPPSLSNSRKGTMVEVGQPGCLVGQLPLSLLRHARGDQVQFPVTPTYSNIFRRNRLADECTGTHLLMLGPPLLLPLSWQPHPCRWHSWHTVGWTLRHDPWAKVGTRKGSSVSRVCPLTSVDVPW